VTASLMSEVSLIMSDWMSGGRCFGWPPLILELAARACGAIFKIIGLFAASIKFSLDKIGVAGFSAVWKIL